MKNNLKQTHILQIILFPTISSFKHAFYNIQIIYVLIRSASRNNVKMSHANMTNDRFFTVHDPVSSCFCFQCDSALKNRKLESVRVFLCVLASQSKAQIMALAVEVQERELKQRSQLFQREVRSLSVKVCLQIRATHCATALSINSVSVFGHFGRFVTKINFFMSYNDHNQIYLHIFTVNKYKNIF